MKRSEFLKRLGLGIAAIPLAPQIVAATKEAFDGMRAKALMDDEAGQWDDGVDPSWMKKPEIHDEMVGRYGHYEEPWLHVINPWPLMINDLVEMDSGKTYLVTKVHYGQAKLTAIDAQDEDVFVYRVGDNLRFYGGNTVQESQYIVIRNFKSEL